MRRTGKRTFIIVTDDGPLAKDVFLTWTIEMGGYYTTVDYVDEINVYDFHDTPESAEDRARDADSGTWGGWPYPMKVMELLNFYEAYHNGEDPKLVEVKVVDLKKD